MPTPAQLQANRDNATRSTGPKTPQGKARSAKNALHHGLRSALPVLPGERAQDWQAHEAGVLHSLAPAGALERELAGRVALCLWRLRRVAAYETAVTAVGLEDGGNGASRGTVPEASHRDAARLQEVLQKIAQERQASEYWEGAERLLAQLLELPPDARVAADHVKGALSDINGELPAPNDEYFDVHDHDFLAGLGVPKDALDRPFQWEGWTAGMVRTAVGQMAQDFEADPEELRVKALATGRKFRQEEEAEIKQLEREARELRRRIKAREERQRQRRLLPNVHTLEKLSRYEAHLSRQMLQALHTLERLQAARAGQPVPPPAALDVTVDGGSPAAALPAPEDAGVIQNGTCRP